MDAESFFERWSRRKSRADQEGSTPQEASSSEAPTAPELKPAGGEPLAKPEQQEQPAPPPTLDDVAQLTPGSDYSRFVAPGVDDNIKRLALKKLFSDPHYNVMDGLDTYIEDYSKFEPIPAALLAKLKHAKALLDPLSHLSQAPSRLTEKLPQSVAATEVAESDGADETGAADAVLESEAAPPASAAPEEKGQAGAQPEADTPPPATPTRLP